MGTNASKLNRGCGEILWKASKQGHLSKVKTLLSCDVVQQRRFINWRDPLFGMTSIMIAIQRGHLKVIIALIDAGADLHLQAHGKEGNTALHYAAVANRPAILHTLLRCNMNPFLWNQHGRSALDVARIYQRRHAIKILQDKFVVYSGWLYCRKEKQMSLTPSWTKRWCMVLPNSPTADRLELVTFSNPSELMPKKVILFTPSEHAVRRVIRSKSTWRDRTFSFEFNETIDFQRMNDPYFSRRGVHSRHPRSKGRSRDFRFATDTMKDLEVWMHVLHGGGNEEPANEEHIRKVPSDLSMTSSSYALENNSNSTNDDSYHYEQENIPVRHSSNQEYDDDITTEEKEQNILYPSAPEKHIDECTVCMAAPRNAVSSPCGHYATCYHCLLELQALKTGIEKRRLS